MPDFFRANLLRLRGKSEERIDLAVDKELHRPVERPCRDPVDVLARIHTYVRHHAGNVDVVCTSDSPDGNTFRLEIPDRPDSLVAEKLVAASMNPSEHDDGPSAIQRGNQGCRTFHCQVCSPRGYRHVRVRLTFTVRHILNMRESLEAQKLFGHILWRQADRPIHDQTDLGDLWRRLCGASVEARAKLQRQASRCPPGTLCG